MLDASALSPCPRFGISVSATPTDIPQKHSMELNIPNKFDIDHQNNDKNNNENNDKLSNISVECNKNSPNMRVSKGLLYPSAELKGLLEPRRTELKGLVYPCDDSIHLIQPHIRIKGLVMPETVDCYRILGINVEDHHDDDQNDEHDNHNQPQSPSITFAPTEFPQTKYSTEYSQIPKQDNCDSTIVSCTSNYELDNFTKSNKRSVPRRRLMDDEGYIRRAACICVDEAENRVRFF